MAFGLYALVHADSGQPIHTTPAKRIFCLTIEQVERLLDQAPGKGKRVAASREPTKPSSKREPAKPSKRVSKPAPVVEDERRQLQEQAEQRAAEMARRRGYR